MIAIDAPRSAQFIYNKYWLEKPFYAVNWLLSIMSFYWVIWSFAWLVQTDSTGTNEVWYFDPNWAILSGIVLLLGILQMAVYKSCNKRKLPTGSTYNPAEIRTLTRCYNQLSPGGKQLARPIVLKYYEIHRSGLDTTVAERAKTKRLRAVEKLLSDEQAAKSSRYIIDNSDLDVLEFVLEAKKNLDDRIA